MNQTKAIIFDFDGTLVDASEAISRSFNFALRECGYPEIEESQIFRMIGAPLVEMFTSRFPEAREDQIEHFVAEYRKVFLSNNLNLTRLLPGVVQVLSHYFPETRLAIATSRRSDGAIRILEKFGLRRYFPIIVGIEHVKDSKPHPEPIYRALEQLGTGPEDSVMVGDTRVDMIAGRRAELQTVGVTTGTSSETDLLDAGAHHVLNRLSDLIHIV
jgi:pyrophosphatase PpaX